MALLNVIKCEAPPSVLAWRHPQNAILYGSQLIVSETQYAYMMKEGRMIGPFVPGTHFLDTKNI
jgi:membrane protease subunit (stomatin/prohibitin family)